VNLALVRPVVAEFVGTTLFVLAGAGSAVATATNPASAALLVPLAHGIAMGVLVTATMNISGGHLNPAVTLAGLATGRVAWRKAAAYLGAQLAGAVLAAALIKWSFPSGATRVAIFGTPALAANVTFMQGTLLEALFTFFLMSAVIGTAVSRDAPKVGGFGIGLAVLASALAIGPLTGGVLNPARAFGPAVIAWEFHAQFVYWIGPIVGAVLAAFLWKLVLLPKEPT
jgi:aquaporin Z